jgi:hypothetical protein
MGAETWRAVALFAVSGVTSDFLIKIAMSHVEWGGVPDPWKKAFTYHPVFMLAGFVGFPAMARCAYILPEGTLCCNSRSAHGILNTLAILFAIGGVVAMWIAHAQQGLPQFGPGFAATEKQTAAMNTTRTIHAWLGWSLLATYLLQGGQWAGSST